MEGRLFALARRKKGRELCVCSLGCSLFSLLEKNAKSSGIRRQFFLMIFAALLPLASSQVSLCTDFSRSKLGLEDKRNRLLVPLAAHLKIDHFLFSRRRRGEGCSVDGRRRFFA